MSDLSPGLTPPAVPAGAADCHVHLFGPHDRYPLSPQRAYTPAEATVEQLLALMATHGMARAVIAHPSAYGTNNALLLDTLRAHPDRFRGIIGLPPDAGQDTLQEMQRLGVRGVRANLVSTGEPDPDAMRRGLRQVAERIAPLGWHLQVFIRLANIPAIADLVPELPVPVVFDHMGLPTSSAGLAQPGLDSLRELLTAGRCWVKLSGTYHVSPFLYGDEDTDSLAQSLVASNPDRLVWASDWPHVGKHNRRAEVDPPLLPHRQIDYAQLLALLARWAGTPATLQKILVDNPARLYGF